MFDFAISTLQMFMFMFYITNQGIVVLNIGMLAYVASSIRYLLYMKKSLITVIGYKYIFFCYWLHKLFWL